MATTEDGPQASDAELELLLRYHDGELSPAERAALEAMLATSERLRALLAATALLSPAFDLALGPPPAVPGAYESFLARQAAHPQSPRGSAAVLAGTLVRGPARWWQSPVVKVLAAAAVIAAIALGTAVALRSKPRSDSILAAPHP